ncbi:NADPH-dependent FMN reductase [Lachnospiraceae bacterium G11]|nr:NADPH-dependent FMN reductase [Lachnospiraceae bacterium G11]
MKILVFNGSPKKENSDTMHITRAFLEGMKETRQQDIHIINIIEQNIEYCTGCFSCMRNGGKCILSDDMREILKEITESDLLIFSFPLYAYGMPAPMKAMIDRLLPLTSMEMREVNGSYRHVGQSDYSDLKFVMICGCGFPNSRNNFEPAVDQFKKLFPMNNTIITIPESPMFNAPEAAPVTVPKLELVKEAGKMYAEGFFVSEKLLGDIMTPMIPEEQYAKIVNG